MSRRRSISQLASIFAGRLPEKPDWLGLVEIANQELITAELHERLRQLDVLDAVPQDLRFFFDEVDSRVKDRMLRLSDTLHDALAALAHSNIAPVLIKGSGLLAEFDPRNSGPATCRIISDLDLLVRPSDLPEAVKALEAAGFAVAEDNREGAAYNVVVLTRPTDVGAIDLHQSPPGPRGVVDVEQLFARSRLVLFRNAPARIAAPEDQILLLVVHDQFQDGHFWRGGFDFRHLIDIARLSSAPCQLDWASLSARCGSSNLRIAMAAQLTAARRLVGARTPSDLPERGWAWLHYWRQRAQFTWPALNRAFNRAGISKNVWGDLSGRFLTSR